MHCAKVPSGLYGHLAFIYRQVLYIPDHIVISGLTNFSNGTDRPIDKKMIVVNPKDIPGSSQGIQSPVDR
jgi:hypothetical protein